MAAAAQWDGVNLAATAAQRVREGTRVGVAVVAAYKEAVG